MSLTIASPTNQLSPVRGKKPMAKLDAAARKEIPKSEFGEPGSRKYPMPDRSHAANAKSRAKQMLNKGDLSPSSYNKIVAKANRKLGSDGKDNESDGDKG